MASENKAAVTTAPLAQPLQIQSVPYTPPQADEIVVKNAALAFNPIDHIIPSTGPSYFPWLTYPFVGGHDVAGTVVEVGSSVTRFNIGDRIVGHAGGFSTKNNHEAAFQLYTVLKPNMTSHIPGAMPFERACVLPLGVTTAACGLYQEDFLGFDLPNLEPKPTGKTLLIWGASTSVGCNAVQLAIASGYDVIATASPHNFELVKRLGASKVFDYKAPDVNEDIIKAFEGKTCAGAFAAAPGTAGPCLEIIAKTKGNKFVASATMLPKDVPEGTEGKFIMASTLKDTPISNAVYEQYLPKAMAEEKFVPEPEPLVVGQGLENVQVALDTLEQGVSAKKVVVTLQ